jgi:hypothetical protein
MAEISAVAGFEQPEELRAESIEDLEAGDTGEVSSVGALPKAESTEMDQPTPLDPQDDAVPSSFNTFRLRVPAEEVTPKPRGGKGRSIVPRMLLARSKTSIAHEPQTLRQVGRSVSSVGTSGTFFQEARPVVGTTYFPAPPASTQTAVVVCLYNEVGPELARTIDSLAASGCPLDVVVVADGLAKLSASMQRYLGETFQLDGAPGLLQAGRVWGARDQIFVSRPISLGGSGSRFTLLLKRFNHKKINTHEWFFRAHCPDTRCRYALTTDTGCVFRSGT